jgi:hypothetical protein
VHRYGEVYIYSEAPAPSQSEGERAGCVRATRAVTLSHRVALQPAAFGMRTGIQARGPNGNDDPSFEDTARSPSRAACVCCTTTANKAQCVHLGAKAA